jgi:hypothetical protein
VHTAPRHEFLHGITDTCSDNLGLLQWNEDFDIAIPDEGWIIFGCIRRSRDSSEIVVNFVAPLCILSRILDVCVSERADAPVCVLKRLIERLIKKVFNKRGETEASEWQTIIRKGTRHLERAIEICNMVLSQKSALISSVVRPFFYLLIRHNLRNELLMENLPHRPFDNIHHNIRTGGSSYL